MGRRPGMLREGAPDGLAGISAEFAAGARVTAGNDVEDPVARLVLALDRHAAAAGRHEEMLRRKARAAWPVEIPPMTYTVTAAGVLAPGPGLAGAEHFGPRTGFFWDLTRITVDGLTGGLGSPQSATGSVTAPAANGLVVQFIPAAGDYMVNWNVQLAGTPAAADANNFKLVFGSQIATSDNPGAVGGPWQQNTYGPLNVPAGNAVNLAVRAIGVGTAGAIYTAQVTITPVAGDQVTLYKRFGNMPSARLHTFTPPGTAPGPDWEPGKGAAMMQDGDRLQLAGTGLSASQVVMSGEAVQIESGWIGEYYL